MECINTNQRIIYLGYGGLFILLFQLLFSCHSQNPLPDKKHAQFDMKLVTSMKNDTLVLDLENPLHCPLTINFQSASSEFTEDLKTVFPIIMSPLSDTLLVFMTSIPKSSLGLTMSSNFGNPDKEIKNHVFSFPFPKGRKYRIIQGYNGSFSHQSDYSRYAIDFGLIVGDTICASADGFVVGVIEGYIHGGSTKVWREYANYITMYHPECNLYTQYVHLKHLGSFVKVGDRVLSGQPIGISGDTGYMDSPHLHFNVLKASNEGLKSTPCNFEQNILGSSLKTGKIVTH